MYIKRFLSFINESRENWKKNQKTDISQVIPDKEEFTDIMLRNVFTDDFNKLQYELNSTKFMPSGTSAPWIEIEGRKDRWLKAHYKIKDIGYLSSDRMMNSIFSNQTLPSRITTLNYVYTGNLGIKDHTNFPNLSMDEIKFIGNKYRDFFELPVASDKMVHGQDIFSNIEIYIKKGKETYDTEDFIVDIKYNNHFITNHYSKEIHKSEVIKAPTEVSNSSMFKEQVKQLIISAFNELYEVLLSNKATIIAEKEKEKYRFLNSVYDEILQNENAVELLLFIEKYMPVLFEQFKNIPDFSKKMYKRILTIPKHLDILYKIKKDNPDLYNDLIKHGNKYTDKYVGKSLDDMLSFKK